MTLSKMFLIPLTLSFALSGVAHAVTYDAADDFSFSSNPSASGVWSYGYSSTLAGTFIAHTQNATLNDLQYWALDIGNTYTPNVDFNPTASDISFASTDFRSKQINLHPGPSDEFSILRFTAPASATYALTSAFNMRSFAGSHSTDVYVLLNGGTQFSAVTANFDDTRSFSGLFALAVGDKLDFVVGSNGNFLGDTTELRVSLAPVPEPETYALMLGGLAMLGACLRRRKGG